MLFNVEYVIFDYSLKEKYSDKPLTWDALAKRHLRGKIKGSISLIS